MQPGEFVKYTIALSAIYYFNKFDRYTTEEKLKNLLNFAVPLGLLNRSAGLWDFHHFLRDVCLCVLSLGLS